MKALLLLSSFLFLTHLSPAAPPNLLFIFSDDHASHALSCYGSKINSTPNLDRIASSGARFSNAFVTNSICTPSRATLMTGLYSHLNGVTVFNRFDGSQPTVAKYLQAAGYYTGIVGKWHLESDPTGFDYWSILPGQGRYHHPEFIEMGKRKTLTGYVEDLIADQSIAFLENRPKDRPFLLFSNPKAPHRNWEPDAKHAHLYDDIDIPTPPTFNDDYSSRSPAAAEATMRIDLHLNASDTKGSPPPNLSGAALKFWKYQRFIKDYLRCVAAMDDNVGRLLDYLKDHDLLKNTVIIYASDNGFYLGDHNWFDKRFMYDPSLRVPLLISAPGISKPNSVIPQMVLNVDFAPTLLDLAGLPIPPQMQGRSLAPLLRGESPPDWRSAMYYRYYHYPGDHRVQPHYGIRTATEKLIFFHHINAWEFYDLTQDPDELHNLINDPSHAAAIAIAKNRLILEKNRVQDTDRFAGAFRNPPITTTPTQKNPSPAP